jgi:hypothetical protein
VACSWECGNEPSGSGTTELVNGHKSLIFLYNFCLVHFYAYLVSYIQDVHKNAHRSSHKGQLSLALIISTMT